MSAGCACPYHARAPTERRPCLRRAEAWLFPGRLALVSLLPLHGCGVCFPAEKVCDPVRALPLFFMAVARKPPAPQLKANHVRCWAGAAADTVVLAFRSFRRCHICHLSIGFGKFANSEAKTEFRLHRYERTAILREVARGVHAPARFGMDVPPNRGGAEHLRANGHGMARGAKPAPTTKGKTPPETSRVSIKDMSGRRETILPGVRSTTRCPPDPATATRCPSTRRGRTAHKDNV